MRFYLLPVKNVQLVFHRSPTFTHDQFKTTCGTYLQSPLPSVSPRILGTCTIISRIKIAICRYTVLLSPSYWNASAIVVRFYVPLNVMLAYLREQAAFHYILRYSPRDIAFFPLNNRFLFLSFFFVFLNFLYYSPPRDCVILSHRVRVVNYLYIFY